MARPVERIKDSLGSSSMAQATASFPEPDEVVDGVLVGLVLGELVVDVDDEGG